MSKLFCSRVPPCALLLASGFLGACGADPGSPDAELEENLGAADLELTNEDLRDIERAASTIDLEAARYPEHLDRLTGR